MNVPFSPYSYKAFPFSWVLPGAKKERDRKMYSTKRREKPTVAEDFWSGKTPCWQMTRCPEPIHSSCPAYHHRSYPCWEIEGTYCKWNEWGANGRDISICLKCEVYLTWGEGRRIELRLLGHGIKLLME
jgi:hypothetical protein